MLQRTDRLTDWESEWVNEKNEKSYMNLNKLRANQKEEDEDETSLKSNATNRSQWWR